MANHNRWDARVRVFGSMGLRESESQPVKAVIGGAFGVYDTWSNFYHPHRCLACRRWYGDDPKLTVCPGCGASFVKQTAGAKIPSGDHENREANPTSMNVPIKGLRSSRDV